MKHPSRPLALSWLLFIACGSSTPAVVIDNPPVAARPNIEVPDSGFWEKADDGRWRYDLGVGFVPEVQLNAPGQGRGLMRVALPPGASAAKVTAMTVKYARSPIDMEPDGKGASGKAIWHVHADAGGQPGARLGGVEVVVDGARAMPIDYEGADGDEARLDVEGTRHVFAKPIEVPATFWLVFERVEGDPRVGGMRLTEGNGLLGTYVDLFFKRTPDAPMGEPVDVRPFIAIDFEGLR